MLSREVQCGEQQDRVPSRGTFVRYEPSHSTHHHHHQDSYGAPVASVVDPYTSEYHGSSSSGPVTYYDTNTAT